MRKLLFGAAAIGLVATAAVAGAVTSVVAQEAGGDITACVSRGGSIRIIASGEACKTEPASQAETPLSWSSGSAPTTSFVAGTPSPIVDVGPSEEGAFRSTCPEGSTAIGRNFTSREARSKSSTTASRRTTRMCGRSASSTCSMTVRPGSDRGSWTPSPRSRRPDPRHDDRHIVGRRPAIEHGDAAPSRRPPNVLWTDSALRGRRTTRPASIRVVHVDGLGLAVRRSRPRRSRRAAPRPAR